MNFRESMEVYLKKQTSLDTLNDLLISYIEQSDARIRALEDLLEIREPSNLIEVFKGRLDLMDESLDDVCALSGELVDKVSTIEELLKIGQSPNIIEQLNYEVEYLSKHITDED